MNRTALLPQTGEACFDGFKDLRQQIAVATANILLAGSLLLTTPQMAAANVVDLNADPVYGRCSQSKNHVHTCTGELNQVVPADGASILKTDARDNLSQTLKDLDRYAVRQCAKTASTAG